MLRSRGPLPTPYSGPERYQRPGLGGTGRPRFRCAAAQPHGPWLLALVAAGLEAYGVSCLVKARYRVFRT
ncbi:MAG TPA: DUF1206 domain-containing protein [Thermoanaerobaculia bacterium]|nr:DUF1206 domain-containing protein [Thermoanaerobaculia bacterium]